jgi:rRNA maturation endonuclease Nob1
MPETRKYGLDCGHCKKHVIPKPDGDCPRCGVLLTWFPSLHRPPAKAADRA